MHYLLTYEKVADYSKREPAHQAAHRAHVLDAVRRGELILGGPMLDPADGCNVILFRGDSATAAELFARTDPYVVNGIVTKWHVRPWQTCVGKDAECPLS